MTAHRPDLGLVLGSAFAPERLPGLARAGEAAGFDELWVVEDYFYGGAIAAAATVLAATTRPAVGIGVMSGLVRHPAVLAMEIAAIARLHPGRFRPGIGLGLPDWLDQMGLRPSSVLGALRESVTCLRALLDGETVTSEGRWSLHGVRLTYPPDRRVPLGIGVAGPRMIELAGEVGDELVLGLNVSTQYVTWAREHFAIGAARAGRAADQRVTCFAFVSLDEVPERARARARDLIGLYVGLSGRNAVNDAYGISDEVMALRDRGGVEAVRREMPDQWIDDLAIVGTAEQCAARVRAYAAAGADSVILHPVDFESEDAGIAMARDLVAALR